jgi:hypothetical protein
MKITDLSAVELLRLSAAIARAGNAEPVLVAAVQDELIRRLERAAASIDKGEADHHEAVYQDVRRTSRETARKLAKLGGQS